MARAGRNFNHLVQSRKKRGHELVTGGVYAYLRHPSYCGFFWWGVGSQLVLGNWLCLVGYVVVLWRFFRRRVVGECVFYSLSLSLHPLEFGFLRVGFFSERMGGL